MLFVPAGIPLEFLKHEGRDLDLHVTQPLDLGPCGVVVLGFEKGLDQGPEHGGGLRIELGEIEAVLSGVVQ